MADIRISDEQAMLVDLASTVAGDVAGRWTLGRSPAETSGPGDERSAKVVAHAGLLELRAGPPAERVAWTDVCLVAEQFGRRAAPAALLGPVLAGELLRAAGVEDGAAGLTLALRRDLTGVADNPSGALAWDAAGATHALVAGPDGLRVHAVAGAVTSADLTRAVATVDPAPERSLGSLLEDEAWSRFTAQALTAVAADLLGVLDAALAAAVEHATQREQFGAPIGSFQAIQALAAEAKVTVEAARSAVWYAGWAVDALPADEALAAARAAKAFTAGAGLEAMESVMQIFGGMSQTWESFCHVWLRRLHADRALFGDESAQHATLAVR